MITAKRYLRSRVGYLVVYSWHDVKTNNKVNGEPG